MGFGRLPAQIGFLAGNLREALLGRDDNQLRQSLAAAAALRALAGGSPIDAYTCERWELLDALTEALEGAHTDTQPLDRLALSRFASHLALLESLQDAVPQAARR
ncbi:MAG: hypothetical protein IT163_12105 [Bryobacterales bacterium]|nr:hypothetical protein [Bryobacterales bacterium]